jgi:hypothetical protein
MTWNWKPYAEIQREHVDRYCVEHDRLKGWRKKLAVKIHRKAMIEYTKRLENAPNSEQARIVRDDVEKAVKASAVGFVPSILFALAQLILGPLVARMVDYVLDWLMDFLDLSMGPHDKVANLRHWAEEARNFDDDAPISVVGTSKKEPGEWSQPSAGN